MRRALSLLVITFLASVSAFANGIVGVWQQNPYNHDPNYHGNCYIACWQFTDDGHFYYEDSRYIEHGHIIRGTYTMSGNQLTITVAEVVYQDSDSPIISVNAGTTTSINVTQSENEIQFDINPFIEIDVKTLDRVSDYPTFSPEIVLPSTWFTGYFYGDGSLAEPDEYHAIRFNSDHTFLSVWEYKSVYEIGSGNWSTNENVLNMIYTYTKSNRDNDHFQPGLSESGTIIICCPEIIIMQLGNETALAVSVPTTDELIDKYFGGIDAPEADKAPLVTATGNGLRIENADGESVIVYTIDGRTVTKLPSYDGKTIVLPNGLYLVKVGQSVVKVSI